MKKAHYFSGIIICFFVAFHLLNHAFAIAGLEKHLSVMETFRLVYRNRVVETFLLLAVVLQIFSGLKLAIQARKMASGFFEKLHVYSGLYLAFFLLIHVSAVLSARLIFDLDSNTYFGAAALNHFPEVLFFLPYYVLAVLSFFAHIACIHYKKTTSRWQSISIIVIGCFTALFLMYALTNRFQGFEIPEEYKKMLEALSF
jgi:hypothetical protein